MMMMRKRQSDVDYMEGSGGLQPFRWFVTAPGFMLIFSS